jgi:NitT/TauT family transport system substrate-binding protein
MSGMPRSGGRKSVSTRRSFTGSLAALAALAARPGSAQTAAAAIRAGVNYVDGFQAWFAQELGLFAKAGLRVETQVFNNGAAAAAGVVGGSLTTAIGNIVTVAQAHDHGVPIVLIAPSILYDNDKPNDGLVVLRESPIRDAKDLAGKTIGVTSVQGILSLVTKAWIDQNGGDSTKSQYVEVTPPQMLAALQRGTIACGLMVDPFLTAAAGDVRIIGLAEASVGLKHLATGWFALRSWVDQHASEVKAFAGALAQASRWANDPAHREEATAIVAKNLGQHVDVGKSIWATSTENASIQLILTRAYRYKYISHPMTVADITWNGWSQR